MVCPSRFFCHNYANMNHLPNHRILFIDFPVSLLFYSPLNSPTPSSLSPFSIHIIHLPCSSLPFISSFHLIGSSPLFISSLHLLHSFPLFTSSVHSLGTIPPFTFFDCHLRQRRQLDLNTFCINMISKFKKKKNK